MEEYTASTFMVTTNQNLQISIKTLIDNINNYLEENPSVYTSVNYLQINDTEFIEAVEDTMSIDWSLLTSNNCDVIIVLK